MSTLLRKAPSRTIQALRQIIVSTIEKLKDSLIADYKRDISHAQDEIESAKIGALFHEKMGLLCRQLAEELTFFENALELARELDEEERIELIEKYFAEKRRRIEASRIRAELDEGDDTDLLKIILMSFAIGLWIGVVYQIRSNERLSPLVARAGIENFEKELLNTEKALQGKPVHKKD